MTIAILHPGKRIGAGAAAILATLVLSAVPAPARAAAGQPELSVTAAGDAYIDTTGSAIGFHLHNSGDAPTTGIVSAVYDARGTTRDVTFSISPNLLEECRQSTKAATCDHAGLLPGQTVLVYPIALASRSGAPPGPAGTVTVTITAEGPEGAVSASLELPVTIRPASSDLVASVEDIGSAQDRVGGGDTRPLHATVFSFGPTTVPGFFLTVTLPLGASFAERYGECVYSEDWEGEPTAGYVYGPQSVTCRMELPLGPSHGVAFSDPESGDAAFNVVFGKNLPGPAEHTGRFEVGSLDAQRQLDATARTAATGGPSLADKVAELRAKAGRRATAERPAAGQRAASEGTNPTGLVESAASNIAEFSIWTRANSHDFEVSVPAVAGSVGDIVEVPYTITNHGPSDGSATWRIAAPSGTRLLPSQWCDFQNEQGEPIAELPAVNCTNEREWPATGSGLGVLSSVIRVKIKSAPGTSGSVVVRSIGPSTEIVPANNTARIMIDEPAGSGGSSGGGSDDDDGLPITGVRTGLIAGIGAGALVVGVALFLLGRRRRTVVPLPAE